MGMYTGIATRLKVKKTAPADVLGFLDFLYGLCDSAPLSTPDKKAPANLRDGVKEVVKMLQHSSSYFETWDWRVKEDKGDHWLYESRASCVLPNVQALSAVLGYYAEHLLQSDGEIVLRSIYEESNTEYVYCTSLCDGHMKFEKRTGWVFESDNGYVSDSDHPRHYKWREEDKKAFAAGAKSKRDARHDEYEFDWPWTIKELEQRVEAERRRRLRLLEQRHSWGR